MTETGEYLKEAMEGDWWGLGKEERRSADLRYTRRGTHDQVSWLASSSEKGSKPVLYTEKKMKPPRTPALGFICSASDAAPSNNHLYTWDQAVIYILVRSNVIFHHSWTNEASSTDVQNAVQEGLISIGVNGNGFSASGRRSTARVEGSGAAQS